VSEPVQIANEGTDLSAELKRGLSYVRKQRRKAAGVRLDTVMFPVILF